jgi:hypothetical protein
MPALPAMGYSNSGIALVLRPLYLKSYCPSTWLPTLKPRSTALLKYFRREQRKLESAIVFSMLPEGLNQDHENNCIQHPGPGVRLQE